MSTSARQAGRITREARGNALFCVCRFNVNILLVSVVSASLEFMDSDTMISETKDVSDGFQPMTTMRKTPFLCQVTDPEEKRRIIGDTFMRVANEVCIT